MAKRWKPAQEKELELVQDERSVQKKAIARTIADKIASYYRGYLGMTVSYDNGALWLFLEAVRDDLMIEVQHHPMIPKELKLEVAKGISGLAKSWDFIRDKEREGGFAWWIAVAHQLIEDQLALMRILGVDVQRRQGPLSDLPIVVNRKAVDDVVRPVLPAGIVNGPRAPPNR